MLAGATASGWFGLRAARVLGCVLWGAFWTLQQLLDWCAPNWRLVQACSSPSQEAAACIGSTDKRGKQQTAVVALHVRLCAIVYMRVNAAGSSSSGSGLVVQTDAGAKSDAEETALKYGLEAGLFKVGERHLMLTHQVSEAYVWSIIEWEGRGLWLKCHVCVRVQAFTTKDKSGKSSTEQAKQLLTQYGSAYLLTSISFAIVSFTLCYLAVDSGMAPTMTMANPNRTSHARGVFACSPPSHGPAHAHLTVLGMHVPCTGVDIAALLAKIGLQVNSTNETVGTFAIAYAAHKALSPVRFPPTVALTPVVAKWLGKKGDTDSEQQQQ